MDSRPILRAHLVGPHAHEVISRFGRAIRNDRTTGDLKSTIFAIRPGPRTSARCFRTEHDP